MKKDIEWLKKEIGTEMIGLESNRAEKWSDVKYQALRSVAQKLDQLDEPEVLSQEWISDNAVVGQYPDGMGYIVPTYKLQNLLVSKQELPVVPTWFDEWWKDVTKGGGNLFHNIERFYNELYSSGTREACDYISGPDNKKKLLNIIINELDYVVEDEQKYFVSSRESVGFWFLSKNNDNEVVIGTNKDYYDRKWESLKLTEEEIKDYDSRYMVFAIPVEEMEE